MKTDSANTPEQFAKLERRVKWLEDQVRFLAAGQRFEFEQTDDAGELVLNLVAHRTNLLPRVLLGHDREARICAARYIIMFLLRENFDWSLARIGRFLGRRDHGTILHGLKVLADLRAQDRRIALLATTCERDLANHLTPEEAAA